MTGDQEVEGGQCKTPKCLNGISGLMVKVSALQHWNRELKPCMDQDHESSTSWFQEADSRVIKKNHLSKL